VGSDPRYLSAGDLERLGLRGPCTRAEFDEAMLEAYEAITRAPLLSEAMTREMVTIAAELLRAREVARG
jgi:hypothetical protein